MPFYPFVGAMTNDHIILDVCLISSEMLKITFYLYMHNCIHLFKCQLLNMIKFSYIVLINERPRDMIVLRLVSLSYKIIEEKVSCILRLQNIDSSYKVHL